jgi:hypothetical protein
MLAPHRHSWVAGSQSVAFAGQPRVVQSRDPLALQSVSPMAPQGAHTFVVLPQFGAVIEHVYCELKLKL